VGTEIEVHFGVHDNDHPEKLQMRAWSVIAARENGRSVRERGSLQRTTGEDHAQRFLAWPKPLVTPLKNCNPSFRSHAKVVLGLGISLDGYIAADGRWTFSSCPRTIHGPFFRHIDKHHGEKDYDVALRWAEADSASK